MLSAPLVCVLIITFPPASSLFPPVKQTLSPLEKLVEINNAFAIRLFRSLSWNDSNLFVSPFVISSGLMALLHGARDKTSTELNQTLGFAENKLYREKFLDAFTELSTKINLSEANPGFGTASNLFLQEDFSPNRTYKGIADKVFRLQLSEIDYRRNGARAVSSINEWFWRTAGKSFRNLTTVAGALVNMIMASSVSLRSKWSSLSGQNFTHILKTFYNNGVEDNVVTLNMAESKDARLLIADSYDFRALDISCGGSDLSVWILLPHRKDGVIDVEDSLSTKLFQEVAASFREVEVDIALPKLNVDYDVDISKVLQKMGIRGAFSETSANFQDITSAKGLALSKVIHKGIVELDIDVKNISTPAPRTPKELFDLWFRPYWAARYAAESTTDIPQSDDKEQSKKQSAEMPDSGETTTSTTEKPPKTKVFPFIIDHPFMFCLMEKSTGLIHSLGRVLRF